MRVFLLNLLLALAWLALSGKFSPDNLIVGFVAAYLLLWLVSPVLGRSKYFSKFPMAIRFFGFVMVELTMANLRVAHDVLTWKHHTRPGVIAVPLEAKTDAEITMLANLITLTPGTLSLDISNDRKVLYVHAMYIENVEAQRKAIKDGFERRVLELLR